MKRLFSIFAVLFLSVGTAWADTSDDAEAVKWKWYRQLAAQGDADAQSTLGLMYDEGQRVAQDYTEAMKWYRLSAAQGDAFAQSRLASMYFDGQGVTQDYAEAVKLYRLSAAQGNAGAQLNLGIMYSQGKE